MNVVHLQAVINIHMKVIDIIKTDHEVREGAARSGLGDVVGGVTDAFKGAFKWGRNALAQDEEQFADKLVKDYGEYASKQRSKGAPVEDFETWFSPYWQEPASNRMIRNPDPVARKTEPIVPAPNENDSGIYADSDFAKNPEFRKKVAARAEKEAPAIHKKNRDAIDDAAWDAKVKDFHAKWGKIFYATYGIVSLGAMIFEVVKPAMEKYSDEQNKINKWVEFGSTPNDYNAGKKSTPADLAKWKLEQQQQTTRILYAEGAAFITALLVTSITGGVLAGGLKFILPRINLPVSAMKVWGALTLAQQTWAAHDIVQQGNQALGDAIMADIMKISQDPLSQVLGVTPDAIAGWNGVKIGPGAAIDSITTIAQIVVKVGDALLQVGDALLQGGDALLHPVEKIIKPAGRYIGGKISDLSNDSPESAPVETPSAQPATPAPNPDTQSTTSPASPASTEPAKPSNDGPQPEPSVGADVTKKNGWSLIGTSSEGSVWQNSKGQMKMVLPGENP